MGSKSKQLARERGAFGKHHMASVVLIGQDQGIGTVCLKRQARGRLRGLRARGKHKRPVVLNPQNVQAASPRMKNTGVFERMKRMFQRKGS